MAIKKTSNFMKKKFTIYFLLTLSFYSGQKEFSSENGQTFNPISATSDSIFIGKVVALDTTKNAPYDTTYILNFVYDNSKRPVKVLGKYYDNQGPGVTNFFSEYSYFYTGIDSLPYKAIYAFGDNSGTDTTLSYPSYITGTARLSKDSFFI